MNISDLQAVLTRIRAIFPEAVIGGGAVRDAYLGRPVKDIDLMISVNRLDFEPMVRDLSMYLDGTVENLGSSYLCVQQTDVLVPGLPPINVISTGEDVDVIDLVHSYDFWLSQAVLTPSGVLTTDKFRQDVSGMQITYTHAFDSIREEWQTKSSAMRLQRLRQKYPTFHTRECGVLEEYLNKQGGLF